MADLGLQTVRDLYFDLEPDGTARWKESFSTTSVVEQFSSCELKCLRTRSRLLDT